MPSPPVALSPTTRYPSASSNALAACRNPAWSSTMRTVCCTRGSFPGSGLFKSPGSSCQPSGQPHPARGSTASVTVALPGATVVAMDVDALYQRHRDALLVFLVRRTADTEVALDLWAETFAQAVASHRRTAARPTRRPRLALGIAKRQLALYYRRGHAEQRALNKLGLERPPASDALLREVEERAALDDLRRDLAEALDALSEPIRDAVQLRIVDELPYADVARSLHISEPAARARVSRGLAALADLLDPTAIREATAT